jgi:hypothetical protein
MVHRICILERRDAVRKHVQCPTSVAQSAFIIPPQEHSSQTCVQRWLVECRKILLPLSNKKDKAH